MFRQLSRKSEKILQRMQVALPPEEGGILAAVSGGADSTALLRGLALLRERHGLRLAAANCNFHLRGEEADRDSAFTARLCERLGVKLHTVDFDAAEYAQKKKISIEMACRELRHEWFRRLIEKEGYARLATGHNSTDNAETMLLNLLRGSGTTGLRGMLPDDGHIIRPLLSMSREEITGFLNELGQEWVDDSTNAESDYRRNFLRNEVMPILRERWDGTDAAIARSIEILRRENSIVEAAIKEALGNTTTLLGWKEIKGFADPQTLIYRFIKSYKGSPEIAEEIAGRLPRPRIGSYWELPQGRVTATAEGLLIEETKEETNIAQYKWEKVKINEETYKRIKGSTLDEAWLPDGPEAYEWRRPKPGERIRLAGKRGSKLISDVLKEGRLTRLERERTQLLSRRNDGAAIWIPGIRRSGEELVNADGGQIWHLFRAIVR